MDRLKQLLATAILLSSQQAIIAQNNKNSINELNIIDKKINESIYINTNANVFVTGETLHYKLHCLNRENNTASTYSKIGYVELIDTNKKSIFLHKIFFIKASGNGDFFIPTTLETGNYKLIGYTSWMLNQAHLEFFNIDISIINPYQTKTKKSNIASSESKANESQQNNNFNNSQNNVSNDTKDISLELSQKKYTSREKVNLKIKTASDAVLNGNYTVSVRKIDQLSKKQQLNPIAYVATKKNQNTTLNINNDDIILPELRGEIISGRIISKNNTSSVENKSVAFSIPGKSYAFEISKTDKTGKFYFNLEKKQTHSNIIIQVIDNNHADYSIEIFKPKQVDYSSLTFTDLELLTESKNSIEERSVACQVDNGYYTKKKDSLIEINDIKAFYDPSSIEYILDDYTRFPTLKETVIEVVDGMYYKLNNNKYTLHLKDYDENTELSIPSLVLVDGLIIQDIDELFQYKTDNIYKINIVKGGYYLGPKLFNGVIAFTTKKNDYESNLKGDYILKPEIIRPLSKLDYFQPDYSDKTKNTRIPDYRYQLLWLPEISLENKESNVSFFTSDIVGEFEITLEGFTTAGVPITVKETIQVD